MDMSVNNYTRRVIYVRDILVTIIFIMYFCHEVFYSMTIRLIGSASNYYLVYNTIFFGCVFLYASMNHGGNLIRPILCYSIITLLFTFTYLLHPEYDSWFFEQTYGIQVQFFRAAGGIWAFLVVSLTTDRDTLYKYLKWVSWILFVFLFFRFIAAQMRGYWVSYDANYERLERDYNLGFGYSMLFPTLFFAAQAFLNNSKRYFVPFLLGLVMVLIGGSRGAIIWIPVAFLIMLPYKWQSMTKRNRLIAVLVLLIIIPAAIWIYLNYEYILQGLSLLLSSRGLSSRTLTTLLTGTVTEANGRDKIYEMVIERIKEGGIFGNGVFGERVVVGQKYRWGYAHNIFLEFYAAFGYLAGTIVSILLVYHCIVTAIHCRRKKDQIIYVTFLMSSMKLLLSDSFWFNSSFWAMLAIIIMWRKQDIRDGYRNAVRLKKHW